MSRALGAAAAAVALLLVLLAVLALGSARQARNQEAQMKADAAQAQAAQDSGRDAIETIGRTEQDAQESERTTLRNDREIRHAPNSHREVDPALHDIGLGSLCRRAAYRDSESCRLLRADPVRLAQ